MIPVNLEPASFLPFAQLKAEIGLIFRGRITVQFRTHPFLQNKPVSKVYSSDFIHRCLSSLSFRLFSYRIVYFLR